MLTIVDKGGWGVWTHPPFLADIICEQPNTFIYMTKSLVTTRYFMCKSELLVKILRFMCKSELWVNMRLCMCKSE